MGINLAVCAVYAGMVKRIDANFACGMYDLLVFQHYPDMYDPPFRIGKVSQVAGLGLGGKMYFLAVGYLLISITRQLTRA